ncbi:MAG: hypothetical protein FJ098_02390 [Deltaproteobacteria bacterium]|nr:hypothetical protein [Deltaproteobacteria bacterium]
MTGRELIPAGWSPDLGDLLARARYGSYFEILGLGPDASFSEVARRARECTLLLDRLEMELPEGSGEDALREIRWSVGEAWRVLSNPGLRESYALGLAVREGEGGRHGPADH